MRDFFKKKSSPQAFASETAKSEIVSSPLEEATGRIMNQLRGSDNNLELFAFDLLSKIAGEKEILQGLFLIYDGKGALTCLAGYAYNKETTSDLTFELGEGLPGQVARDRKLINLKNVPNGYIIIKTGLGQASPDSLIIFPVCHRDTLLGVIELASFHRFTAEDEEFFTLLSEKAAEEMMRITKKEEKKNA